MSKTTKPCKVVEKCRKLRETYNYQLLHAHCKRLCEEALGNPQVLPNWINASGIEIVDDNNQSYKFKFGHYIVARFPKTYTSVFDGMTHAIALLLQVKLEDFAKTTMTKDQAVLHYLQNLVNSYVSHNIRLIEHIDRYSLKFDDTGVELPVYNKEDNKALNGAFHLLRLDSNGLYLNCI